MTNNNDDRPVADDVETLAREVSVSDAVARAVLASDWFRDRIAAAEQRARADERERIAQAIEARRGQTYNNVAFEALTIAARIAREGGQP